MSYLNNETQYLAKYASFITGQALELVAQLGAENSSGSRLAAEISAYKTYREAVVDTDNSEQNQLDALTVLVNYAPLDPVPIPPTFSAFNPSFIPTPSYIGVHNDLSGLNVGDYQHLTQAQLSKLNNLPTAFTFAGLSGSPNDNAALAAALTSKQATIPTGTTGQFYGWDKTMRAILWSHIGSTPTTLAGYGISASDTLFDSKYLRLISPLTGLGSGTATPITATDSVLVAFQNLQAQISAGSGITALTGDVTASGTGSVAATIGANRVTNAMLAQVATATFKGRTDGGTGNVQDLSVAQATALLNAFVGDSGSGGTKGMVPAPATGDAAALKFLKADGTWAVPTGAGTVTSVAAAGPTGLITWSAAVTGAGTLTATLDNQSAATVFAGPATGSPATPAFRALVATDIPNIAITQVTGLSSALINKLGTALDSAKIFVGNGSNAASPVLMSGDATMANTGAITISANAVTFAKFQQIDTLALASDPKLLGRWSAGLGNIQEVTLDPTTMAMSPLGVLSAIAGGTGDVVGPGSATDNAIARFDGTTGKLIQNSTVAVSDTGQIQGITLLSINGATSGFTTLVADPISGFSALTLPTGTDTLVGLAATQTLTNKTLTAPVINVGSDATGDIYYRNAGGLFTRLPVGSDGDVLTLASGIPSWAASGGGSTANQSFTSQTSITVTHNRGYYPLAQVIDNSGNLLSPTSVVHASTNAFTVTLSSSTTGNIIYA